MHQGLTLKINLGPLNFSEDSIENIVPYDQSFVARWQISVPFLLSVLFQSFCKDFYYVYRSIKILELQTAKCTVHLIEYIEDVVEAGYDLCGSMVSLGENIFLQFYV